MFVKGDHNEKQNYRLASAASRSMATIKSPTSSEYLQFFQELAPSESFHAKKTQIDEFTRKHAEKNGRVVLVTVSRCGHLDHVLIVWFDL